MDLSRNPSGNSDLKELNAVIDQMTDIQNKKMKASAKHRQDVRSLLTDEQKVFFDSRHYLFMFLTQSFRVTRVHKVFII